MNHSALVPIGREVVCPHASEREASSRVTTSQAAIRVVEGLA